MKRKEKTKLNVEETGYFQIVCIQLINSLQLLARAGAPSGSTEQSTHSQSADLLGVCFHQYPALNSTPPTPSAIEQLTVNITNYIVANLLHIMTFK